MRDRRTPGRSRAPRSAFPVGRQGGARTIPGAHDELYAMALGTAVAPRHARCRPRSRGVRIERVCEIGCGHREMAYWRERRHPAARASASVQNHRSPFEVSMRVRS